MADKYVFHFFMSNRLSDRYPGRAQKHTPLNHSRKGYSIARQTIWGRMQYAPTLPAEKSDLMGWWEGMFWEKGEEYVFHFSMSNRLLDRYPGRGVLHTPLAHLSSTLSSFAGRLVGRMQYAPTLPEKDEVSSCRCFPLSRTIRDKSVFLFSMSNWLSDRYPGRAQKHTPLARLSSTPTPFAGRLVGRMQYAPILSEKDKVSSGRCFPLSRTMVDKYVSFFSMSNRLSDRYPCRGVLHTPHIDLTSTLSPFAGRLVGRMLLRPTLPAEKSDFKGCCGVMFGTRRDEYVFHFSMSNRLSDRYPGRGVLNTPLACLSSTPTPFAGRLVGRMQYDPTFPKKIRFPWVGIFHCLGQSKINTYFISPCLIGYQMGTRVGRKSIRPLRIYRLPFRPLQGVWWGVCNTPLHFRKKMRFHRVGITYCLGQSEMNTYFISPCLIGYQMGTHVGAY